MTADIFWLTKLNYCIIFQIQSTLMQRICGFHHIMKFKVMKLLMIWLKMLQEEAVTPEFEPSIWIFLYRKYNQSSNVIVSRFGNSNTFQILLVHFTKNVFPSFTIEIFPVVLKFFVFKLATGGSTVTCNELVYMTPVYAQGATFQKMWSIIFLCAQSTITKDQF